MAIVVLLLLFVMSAAVVVYPFLSRQASTAAKPAVTDLDIERALRRLRAARGPEYLSGEPEYPSGGLRCPACAHPYLAGDRFCVKCGADLPSPTPTPASGVGACPKCGAPLRVGDLFCSKCGHRVADGEEV